MTRRWRFVALAAALAATLAAAAPASACRPRTSLADVEDEVMCVVCGVPLSLATDSAQGERERALIARRVAACWNKPRIKSELVAAYGTAVLAAPSGRGFGISAWVVPLGGIAVLGGSLVVATGARRRRRPPKRRRSAA